MCREKALVDCGFESRVAADKAASLGGENPSAVSCRIQTASNTRSNATVALRDLLGCKIATAPGGFFGAGVGETWVASKLGGLKVRNSDDLENPPHEVSLRGDSGKPTHWRDLG